jgi:MFS family permease
MTDQTTALARRPFGFVLAAVATIAMMTGASAPSPFYPALQERLGLPAVGITIAFAVYAVALLIALLVAGSVSDHIGRRPVLAVGFVILALSVVLIWASQEVWVLYLARTVQGIATGLLISTLSATIADFAPPARPRSAAVLNSVAPMIGLALGAVVAGTLLDLTPHADTLVFLPLAVVYLVIAAAVWLVPETSSRERGWLRSLRPRVAVPPEARRMFLLTLPVVVAGWATGGLFLSIGASIVHAELHVDGHTGQGLTIGLLPAAGVVAVLLLRNSSSRFATIYGSIALAVGTALSLIALALGSVPLYVVAIVIAGTGFGTAFMGTIGSLAPLVAVHQRAELFAAIYTASYLAFGVPAVIAGALVGVIGLGATVEWYGALVTIAAALAAVLRIGIRSPAPTQS